MTAPDEIAGARRQPSACPARAETTKWRKTAVLAAFLASGASGLVLELVWTRQFALVFGTSEAALSAVLAAYMAGVAIGGYLFGRLCQRWREPLWLYTGLEVGIALFALLSPVISHVDFLPRALWSAFTLPPPLSAVFRFVAVFGIIAMPTTLMGGTLPTLCQAWPDNDRTTTHFVGALYAANLMGAVAGTFASGFFLIPTLGIQKTTFTAALLNMLAAVTAGLAALGGRRVYEATSEYSWCLPANQDRFPDWRQTVVFASVGVSGFAALIEEILWSRSLRMVVGSSTYALTLMLLTFLLGLGLGSYLVARFGPHIHRPVRLLAGLQAGVYVFVLLAIYLYPSLPRIFLLGFSALGPATGVFILQATLAALLLLPSAALLGALFPLSARVVSSGPRALGFDVGRLYAIQTFGNVLGAASAIAWVAHFGLRDGLLTAAALHLTAGAALWLIAEAPRRLRMMAAAATATAIMLIPLVSLKWQPLITTSGVYQSTSVLGRLFHRPEDFFSAVARFRLLFYREGVSATVSVYERPTLEPRPHLSLAIDGKVDASTGADMATQVLSAHLPLSTLPQAQDICVVGWASGVTVGSVLLHPVRSVTAIEIEPAVISASSAFDEFNHRPLRDPRLRLVIGDARNVLLMDKRQYDIIISEPSNPWLSGPAKLFTTEFFRLGKNRLNTGGVFAQWIQLYGLEPRLLRSMIRTFHSVFPFVTVFQTADGDLLLLGRLSPVNFDARTIEHRLHDPAIHGDLARVNVYDSIDLLGKFLLGWKEMNALAGQGPLNTDDNGLLEFGAPKSLYLDTVPENLRLLRSSFHAIEPYLSSPNSEKPIRIAQRAIRQGNWEVAEMFDDEVRALPPSADRAWILGEIEWKHKNYITAERWWQEGIALDRNHFGCLLSKALADQQLGRFHDAEASLEQLSRGWPNDPFVGVIHGVNRLALQDPQGAGAYLGRTRMQDAFSNEELTGTADPREALLRRFFPLPVLASFYSAQAARTEGDEHSARRSEEQAMAAMERWRSSLLGKPTTGSRAVLLAAVDLLSSRAPAIEADRRLLEWAGERLLQPLAHYDRAVSLALLGNATDAKSEFSQAIAQVTDNVGRSQIMVVCRKLEICSRDLGMAVGSETHIQSFLKRYTRHLEISFRPSLRCWGRSRRSGQGEGKCA